MDKKILSAAIIAAMAAPVAALADTTLYGQVHLSVGSADSTIRDDVDSITLADEMQQNNHASRLGVKGSEDLGGSMKANYQLEWGVNPDGGTNGGFSHRNQWLGLSGDSWGEIRVGRHDTPMKMAQGGFDQFNDTFADIQGLVPSLLDDSGVDLVTDFGFSDAEAAAVTGALSMSSGEERLPNMIAYVSPSYSGFSVAAAGIAGEESPDPVTSNDDDQGLTDTYSLAAMYNNGPLFASLAYNGYDADTDSGAKDEVLRGIVTYKIGDAQIGGLYEQADFVSFDDGVSTFTGWDKDTWGLSANYALGAVVLKGQFMTSEADFTGGDSLEQDQWTVGADYNFSKRTTAYFMYTDVQADIDVVEFDYDYTSVGMIHKF